MSRTDVHRPWWVQERDPHVRRDLLPHHNHWVLEDWDPELRMWRSRRSVPCDLDERLSAAGYRGTRCMLYPNGRRRFCPCRRCGTHPGHKLARRQERTRWRSARARLLAAIAEERDELDVPAFRGSAW
jgi:hypothetical protein